MAYTLTSKSQVTVPKEVRKALNIGPGQEIDYLIEPDGRVVIVASRLAKDTVTNPFLAMVGIGIRKRSTDEIMRQTRGQDWNQ